MVNVHLNPTFDDQARRQRLFAGDVVVYTDVPEVAAFAAFTRGLISDVFAPLEPTRVHESRTPQELANTLIDFKPRFIHHPESAKHVSRVVTAIGGDAAAIYADFSKLRTAFPEGGLSTGIAYAFQTHRDTWYGAPAQQINWWMPVWPVAENNTMEFYPRGFGNVIENNSRDYNYYEANAWRGRIKDFSGARDTRVHPAPVTPLDDTEPRLCLVVPVGGIMLFSGDQLHATIPNTSSVTRYSVDFRTVHEADVRNRRGAPCADVACTGTALRDFHRLTDQEAFAEAEVAAYDTEGAPGVRIYQPQ